MTTPSNQPKSQMFEFETQYLTRIYVLRDYMVSNWVNSRVRARNRPIHITRLGCHLGRCLGVLGSRVQGSRFSATCCGLDGNIGVNGDI